MRSDPATADRTNPRRDTFDTGSLHEEELVARQQDAG
jgi:hypothetical protein